VRPPQHAWQAQADLARPGQGQARTGGGPDAGLWTSPPPRTTPPRTSPADWAAQGDWVVPSDLGAAEAMLGGEDLEIPPDTPVPADWLEAGEWHPPGGPSRHGRPGPPTGRTLPGGPTIPGDWTTPRGSDPYDWPGGPGWNSAPGGARQ